MLSVLVSATLAKLGEAAFNSFWSTVEPSDIVAPARAYWRLLDAANVSVLVFIGYYLLVLARHLGAIHSTQIILGCPPRDVWVRAGWGRFLPIADFAATFAMFMLHYTAAYGLSEAVKRGSEGPDLSIWPLAVLPLLLTALLLDILICAVGVATAQLASRHEVACDAEDLKTMNIAWMVASSLEFAILFVVYWLMAASIPATIAILIAIAISFADLAFTWSYWGRIALLDPIARISDVPGS